MKKKTKTAKDFGKIIRERAGDVCEIGFRFDNLVAHHIDGKKKPRKSWPEELREDWPDCELNGVLIPRGIHGDAKGRVHATLRYLSGLIWLWLRERYKDRVYKGKTYPEWMAGPGPWEEYLSIPGISEEYL